MGDVPACAGARGAASGPGVGMDGAGWGTGVRGVALGVTGAMGGQWQGGEHVYPPPFPGLGEGAAVVGLGAGRACAESRCRAGEQDCSKRLTAARLQWGRCDSPVPPARSTLRLLTCSWGSRILMWG